MESIPKSSTPQEHTGGGYIASADVLELYGDWIQPSEKVALEKFYKAHTHHEIYKDVDATRIFDLKVFGQGHMLYFYFIKVHDMTEVPVSHGTGTRHIPLCSSIS